MIATLLFVVFVGMMLAGVPIGVSLGLAGAAAIALANAGSQWFGLLAVPQNFYAGLGKYPLLAIPMFVLVGSIFDRSGVALRLVNFATAIVGRGPGMLPLVVIAVCHVHGRYFWLRPGHCGGGGRRDDCRHDTRRLCAGVFSQCGGGSGLH
jgi:TRAP-type mannitol/chloroaromatic compound transport system permease large subunit